MMRAQIRDPTLHLVVERIVGGAQVGELGVGGHRWHDLREEHRIAPGRILERGVGVPETVAKAVGAAPVLGLEDSALGIEVGDVGERLVAEAALAEDRGPRLAVQLAVEALGESELLGIGEFLAAKHEHAMRVHSRANRLERFAVLDVTQIQSVGLACESQIAKGNAHAVPFSA